MREIISVTRDDWYGGPAENGRSVFAVKFRDTDGLLYMVSVSAFDELDAYNHVAQGVNPCHYT